MKNVIREFQGTYRPFSNFWFVKVSLDGLVYPTVEHAYQAAKTLDEEDRDFIRHAPKPGDAKRAGKNLILRSDWEDIKRSIMLDLVRQKFQRADLKKLLLSTGDAELIEGNHWHDNYWGVCYCGICQNNMNIIAHNWLGKTLMQVREELRCLK